MESRKTVGAILADARKSKKVSFREISAVTKINPKFLNALEAGDYSVFSSPLHIKGFLKNYAGFLELDESEILAFWRREYNAAAVEKKTSKKPPKPLKDSLLDIGPAFFAIVSGVLLVTGFVGYLVYQYIRYSAPPKLLVSSPQGDLVVEKPEIDVFGVASVDAELTVNAEKIVLGEGGEFLVKLPLNEGLNLVNIIAKNKFDKEVKKTFKVVYDKPKPPPEQFDILIVD
jgi:cytoskeletal protein RodZ